MTPEETAVRLVMLEQRERDHYREIGCFVAPLFMAMSLVLSYLWTQTDFTAWLCGQVK